MHRELVIHHTAGWGQFKLEQDQGQSPMDGGRRSRSVGVERGRARRRLGEELNADDGAGGAGNDGAAKIAASV